MSRPLLLLAALLMPRLALAQSTADASDGIASASATEQVAFVQDVRSEIASADKQLTRMLEQQEKQGDANAVECLVVRLTSVQALAKVTMAAQTSLVSALTANAEERALHEIRKVTVAMTKTRALMGEAQRCAAGQKYESGSTTTEVTSDELTSNDAFVVGGEPPDSPPVSAFL